MSTAARKARKKAGIPFAKPAKVGTPPHKRAIAQVTKLDPFFGFGTWPSNRAKARIVRLYGAAPIAKRRNASPKAAMDYIARALKPSPTSPLT